MSTTTKTARFTDTMLSATDAEAMASFYRDFVGMDVAQENPSFVMLVDPVTKQSLCITKGKSAGATSPGISVDDLEAALTQLVELGGSIRDRWDYEQMRGANCSDPEGNEIMVWQNT